MVLEQQPEYIIYLRTSTDEQNPENQLKDVQTIAKKDSVVLTETRSAWKNDSQRERFNIILNLIKKGKLKELYVWDLDRIYRNRKKLIEFFQLCRIQKCSVHSFRQQWLGDLAKIPPPFNEMMFDLMLQVMGWLAEEESNKKSERVKNAIRYKEGRAYSRNGKEWGRNPLSNNTILKVLELNKEGKSIRQIAREVTFWDKNGNKKNVSKSAVHKIITKNSLL